MGAQRCVNVSRVVLIVLFMLSMMASTGRCGRLMNGQMIGGAGLFGSILQKGTVPPPGRSPCHNMIKHSNQTQLSQPDDDIIC
ncbi:hypothetical protein AAC387_Pa05g3137 [Persea americana]